VAWRALRARQWAHFALLPATTLLDGALFADPVSAISRAARGALVAALALAYAYGLNAITDRATDRDREKNPLAGTDCPPSVIALVLSTGVTALALAALGGRIALAATALSLVAATLYSVGPHLKAIPVVGTSVNGAIFAPLLVVAPSATVPAGLPLLCATFLALLFQNQLLHERADLDEDRAAGVVTTGRLLGEKRIPLAMLALAITGALAALLLATSHLALAIALAAIAAATGISFIKKSPQLVRLAHRRVALAGGAALFLALLLP
jgi:4-hydroxybenzoate polyprenyltransferase